MTDPLLPPASRWRAGGPAFIPALTSQERTHPPPILADGMTNRQIAERMFLAEKTVKNYVSNLLAKLDMSRRSEAAAYAARLAARRVGRPRGGGLVRSLMPLVPMEHDSRP